MSGRKEQPGMIADSGGRTGRHGQADSTAQALGRGCGQLLRGKWSKAAHTFRLWTWVGRYLGFVLAVAIGIATIPAFLGAALPLSTIGAVMVCVAIATPLLLPLALWTADLMLLGNLRFFLRARSFRFGCAEGAVLAGLFVIAFCLVGCLKGLNDRSVANAPNGPGGGQPPSSTKRHHGLGPLPVTPDALYLLSSEDMRRAAVVDSAEVSDEAKSAYHRGMEHFKAKEFEEALKEFSASIEADEKLWPAFQMRGKTLVALGQPQLAVNEFTKAHTLDPGILSIHVDRAEALYLLGDVQGAIKDCDAAGTHSPDACNLRGLSRSYLGDYELAIQDFTLALKLDPKRAVFFANRAFPLLTLGYLDDALDDCNRAIEIIPDLANGYYMRGRVWMAKGDGRSAVTDLSEAIRLDPGFASAYLQRALARASSGDESVRDYRAAVQDATRACELTGWQDYMAMEVLAQVYAAGGDEANAQVFARRAIEAAPAGRKAAIRDQFGLPD